MVDIFIFSGPDDGDDNPYKHLRIPASVRFPKEKLKALKEDKAGPFHHRILAEAAYDFSCALIHLFQSHEKFELPAHGPVIAVVGDDLFRSLGPGGFEEESLVSLIKAAGHVAVVTCEPPFQVYAEAATLAAKFRKNVVIVETSPSQGREWCQFVRETNPAASLKAALVHGESPDGYA